MALNIFGKLLNDFMNNPCSKCEKVQKEVIANLDLNQIDEWGSIKALYKVLDNQLENLASQKDVLDARRQLFWARIRCKSSSLRDSVLFIEDDKIIKQNCSILEGCLREDGSIYEGDKPVL